MLQRVVIAILALAAVASAGERDFLLRLKIEHAQLGDLFIGCRDGATDGYDSGVDDMAPPHGMNTGYVGLVNRSVTNSLLYKDIKAHGDLKEWEILLEVQPDKPLKISWAVADVPRFYDLTFVANDFEKDMRGVEELVFTSSQRVAIVAGLRPEALPEAEPSAKEPAPGKTPVPAKPETTRRAPEPKPEPAAEESSAPSRVAGGISILVLGLGACFCLSSFSRPSAADHSKGAS